MRVQVPFPVLHGECVEYVEKTEEIVIALSSYRLHIKFKDNIVNVSLSFRSLCSLYGCGFCSSALR